jgi:transposase
MGRVAARKNISEVTKVLDMFKRHLERVINALTSSFSNAMAERLNGKILELKTVGKEYRRFENIRSDILFSIVDSSSIH